MQNRCQQLLETKCALASENRPYGIIIQTEIMYKNNKKPFPGENFFIPELDYTSQYLPIDTKIVKKLSVFPEIQGLLPRAPLRARSVSRNKQRACTKQSVAMTIAWAPPG